MSSSPETQRLHTAFDLFDAGVRIMQARLRRSQPQALPTELEALLAAWLLDRPGARYGDASGRPTTWPHTP